MKILFIISAMYQHSGKGGHYYSLKTTVEALSQKLDCSVVVIGIKESPVINQMNIKKYNMIYDELNTVSMVKDLKNIVNIENPDIIHSFDDYSLFFGKVISTIYKKPIIHTKCGGENPKIFYPKVNNLIVYSTENKEYFENSNKFKKSKIYFMPNRVHTVDQDLEKINHMKSMLKTKSKIFLIISRLHWSKKNGILQSINIVNKLNEDGINSHLFIVGTIQDKHMYEELKNYQNENITIITDKDYTINSSKLIEVADFVIGSGRSFMEAASKGKIMLCPIKDSQYPLLNTEENFCEAFGKNFSERLTIGEYNSDKNYENIKRASIEEKYATEISKYIKKMSQKYFEIESQVEKYQEVYKKITWKPCISFLDILIYGYNIDIKPRIKVLFKKGISSSVNTK